jgi:hypothetical protein
MEFIGNNNPTRRTVVIGGIAAGALAVVDPACWQARAALAAGIASPAPRDDTAYSLHGVTRLGTLYPYTSRCRSETGATSSAERRWTIRSRRARRAMANVTSRTSLKAWPTSAALAFRIIWLDRAAR